MKTIETLDSLDQQHTMRPFRNWDTIEKEKEVQEAREGIVTYLKKIGILPGKQRDGSEASSLGDFEKTFMEVVDEERLQIEMAGKQMGNEDFAYCLMRYFDIMVDRLQMKFICQGIIS